MSPKKSPKTSKPAPLFAVVNETIRGPEVPKKSIPERNLSDEWTPNCTYTCGSECIIPAQHVFSFGEVSEESCFSTLEAASKCLYQIAAWEGERRGREKAKKEMIDRITGKDDYDD